LKDARERARAARLSLLDGIDPLEAKKAAKVQRALAAAKAMTFSAAARGYLDQHSAKWRNAVHAAQWPSTLRTYVEPIFGQLPVAEIDVPLVLKVLEQKVAATRRYPAGSFWMTRPETAKRVRGRIEAILEWAKARGYRTGDKPSRVEHDRPSAAGAWPDRQGRAPPRIGLSRIASVHGNAARA
jgi:hypothetical protein